MYIIVVTLDICCHGYHLGNYRHLICCHGGNYRNLLSWISPWLPQQPYSACVLVTFQETREVLVCTARMDTQDHRGSQATLG